MKIGDKAIHLHTGWTGIIIGFQKRNHGALFDISDSLGIKIRWVNKFHLRVISE